MASPYEEIGGETVIFAVVDDLYTRLFADPMVGFLFAGHDRNHIVRAQVAFTRRMLGDPTAVYTGKPIPEAHQGLPILPGHFDRRHHLLLKTLTDHGVPERPREAWLQLDQGLRKAILKVGCVTIEELRWKP